MVLFSNINLNQRVELQHDNQIYTGTVKYKGGVNTLIGDWVGISLDYPGNLSTDLASHPQPS